MTAEFQRARRPEQMALRRAAILEAARGMLTVRTINDISLRDLSEHVGLAKSNVLRYFDTREAIFLELLHDECHAWLADVEAALGTPRARSKSGHRNEIRFATAIAESLAERTVLCELLGAMAGVLERNISTVYALDFKLRAVESIAALAALTSRHLPWLSEQSAALFAEGALTLTAGMYPFSAPTEPVRAAMAQLGMPDPRTRFVDGLREGLITWLIGATVRDSQVPRLTHSS